MATAADDGLVILLFILGDECFELMLNTGLIRRVGYKSSDCFHWECENKDGGGGGSGGGHVTNDTSVRFSRPSQHGASVQQTSAITASWPRTGAQQDQPRPPALGRNGSLFGTLYSWGLKHGKFAYVKRKHYIMYSGHGLVPAL